jgi:hypothetical protein
VAGAQQFEEVKAALGVRGAEPGDVLVADLRAEAVSGLVAGAGVVNRDPVGAREPGTEHLTGLGEEVVLTRIE